MSFHRLIREIGRPRALTELRGGEKSGDDIRDDIFGVADGRDAVQRPGQS